MKQFKLMIALLVAFCLPTMQSMAIEQVDGVYQIGTAADLTEFAQLVTSGSVDINAVLTADIDYTEFTQINGSYAGTFDGKGHTITLNVVSTEASVALFTVLDKTGVIKNLNLAGNIRADGKYAASYAASMRGGRISNCISSVNIISGMSGDATDGGFVGHTENNNGSIIENSMFCGSITSTTGAEDCAGFCGWADKTIEINNCMMIAEVSVTSSVTYARNPGNATVVDCIHLQDVGSTPSTSTLITEDQLASGEACYIVNGRQSTSPIWYQTIGQDARPVLDNTHGIVYVCGRQHCNGDAYQDATAFSNTNAGIITDEHQYENGICTYCLAGQPDYIQPGQDGWYNISTPLEWNWFAAMVNSGNAQLNARVVAAIDFTDVAQIPIGNTAHKYSGTFDGQFYPISNINAMPFGTTEGATISQVFIQSGVAVGDATYAAHQGTIVGHATGSSPTTMTLCYSLASIESGRGGDTGGISGKFYGTMQNCLFAGTIQGQDTTGGLIGSSNESATPAILTNCVVASSSILGGWCADGICGWQHSNCVFTNCYAIEGVVTNLNEYSGGTNTNVTWVNTDQLESGALAYTLNGNTFLNANWYQNIGEENYPVPNPSHGLVYSLGNDTYACAKDEAGFQDMAQTILDEGNAYCEGLEAGKAEKNAYLEALNALSGVTAKDDFFAAFVDVQALRDSVTASAAAYQDYEAEISAVKNYVDENGSTIQGPSLNKLEDYLEGVDGPSEDYPNGCYGYIKEELPLSRAEITAEIDFVKSLLEAAILNGYSKDSEITNLMVNADLSQTPNFNGWTYTKKGTTLTVGGVKEVMPAAESWNATFNLNQTLTDLTPGVYELQANACFRGFDNLTATGYGAMLYANGNEIPVMMENEDVVSLADAVDLQNCYITEGASNIDYTYPNADEAEGYVPYGPLSCSYAFAGGRYLNHILANVGEDGTLTVGLRVDGTGQSADWCGFGNFRLFYRGTVNEAVDALSNTLTGYVNRANTTLAYQASAGEDYAQYPNFSQSLRDELSAAVAAVETANSADEKLALIQQFTQIFQNIYTCKKAYISLITMAEAMNSQAYDMFTANTITQEQLDEVTTTLDNTWEGYAVGQYSLEEAQTLLPLQACSLYETIYGSMPHMADDGVYEIGTPAELLWFAQTVNSGNNTLNGRLVQAIDLTDCTWAPIGNTTSNYAGEFDGQFYPITNLPGMLFGTISGASITRVAIESGTANSDASYAAHNGSIVGHANVDAPSTLTLSYSKGDVNGTNGGDTGGLAGKFYGTIQNCFFAGKITGTNTIGGLVGSSSESATPLQMSFCFSNAQSIGGTGWYKDAIIGWEHSNCNVSNCYAIEGIGSWMEHYNGTSDNVSRVSADVFASGQIAYTMNELQGETNWYQTIGEDAYPVLLANHGKVILNADGTYSTESGVNVANILRTEKNVNVYDLSGRIVRANITTTESLQGLPKGIYLIGGKKVAKQ